MSSLQYCILGYPLGHTMSPPIHNRLFELAGIQAEYLVSETSPEELPLAAKKLLTLSGFNITIPHKVPIIPYLDELSDEAVRYGAVNCVKCGEKNIGYNTDVIGFTCSIKALGATLSGKVILLGCGGVGRMMAIETVLQGGALTLAVREADIPAAQALCADIAAHAPYASVEIVTLDNISGEYDLMINATPVGMYPHADAMPVAAEVLEHVHYLFDAVYNPIETKLMHAARELGVIATGGMAMLVWQAVAAHEIWNGSQYKDEDIAALVAEMEQEVVRHFQQNKSN